MKWLAVLLCVTQLSLLTLCCCSFQTTACHDEVAPTASAQIEMPSCHQAPPPCHGANEAAEPETDHGVNLKRVCQCDNAQASDLMLASTQNPAGPSIQWQIQPYAHAASAPFSTADSRTSQPQTTRIQPPIADHGLSASRLCRFLI